MNDEKDREYSPNQEEPKILEYAHRTPMMQQPELQNQPQDPALIKATPDPGGTNGDKVGPLELDEAIVNRQALISFNSYNNFIDLVLCPRDRQPLHNLPGLQGVEKLADLSFGLSECSPNKPLYGMNAYELLKAATEIFLALGCCFKVEIKKPIDPAESSPSGHVSDLDDDSFIENYKRVKNHLRESIGQLSLPYLDRIFTQAMFQGDNYSPFCIGIRKDPEPCMFELIWSYWHEEGMLVQTINAISLRFQNKSIRTGKDPLARLELAYLRPLNNLLWGYIQDEPHRLTVARRAYEYAHHYGLSLDGKAVPRMRPADSRSKFIEAFHDLLHQCSIFFMEQANQQVTPDTFPLLNAIKDVQLLLWEGMHNQFGDLPRAARVDMLIQKWILSRPEIIEFLGGRAMTPYVEKWMGVVDTMKQLQGWGDVTVRHFRDLAVYGERLLLSIRYRDWSIGTDELARVWANQHRPAIQGYIHSYKAVTGVDLSADTTEAQRVRERAILPSVHLRNRLALNQRRG